MVRRWCAVTLVAAVMMVPMAACADDAGGGATPPPTDPAALARLVDATRAIDSGRVEVRTTYAGLGGAPGGPDAVRMVQRAAFDRRAG
ncbi:MAG TPA: hypothetical protein VF743_03300, partial [Acidimicrobiales bacterium]